MKYGNIEISAKEMMMKRFQNELRAMATFVKEDTLITTEDKLEQMKIIEGVKFFLEDYDNNLATIQFMQKMMQSRTQDIGREPGE